MFEIKGRESQWKTIYRELKHLAIGSLVTLDELKDMVPNAHPNSVRPAFFRAVKELELNDSRTFINVRGVGYRMAEAREHENLARRQQKFAKRRIAAGLRVAAAADRSLLTPDELRRLTQLEQHLQRQQSFMRQLEQRTEKVELKVAETVEQVEQVGHRVALTEKDALQMNDRVDQLFKLLERHGIAPDADDIQEF